jgi:hypothetical protein
MLNRFSIFQKFGSTHNSPLFIRGNQLPAQVKHGSSVDSFGSLIARPPSLQRPTDFLPRNNAYLSKANIPTPNDFFYHHCQLFK